jgi:hypothetical protein
MNQAVPQVFALDQHENHEDEHDRGRAQRAQHWPKHATDNLVE